MENRVYKTGDTCPIEGCGGWIKVYSSNRSDQVVTRYHMCEKCGHKPKFNKTIVPSQYVPRRRPRS